MVSKGKAVGISGEWSTRANALSALRVALAALLVGSLFHGASGLAGWVFAAALITDLADGWVARRFREVSPLGGLIDHAADATFVTAGCAALAWQGQLPWSLPALIALAFFEYAGSAWRSPERRLRGSRVGRWNGIAYYGIVGIPVLRDALQLSVPGPQWLRVLGWGLVVSTLFSMGERRRRERTPR